jgi:2-keto-4-pentenoate hydratase/2-oxohepta-3-ene-1,7-dioic acid hydratase in catechol pathway
LFFTKFPTSIVGPYDDIAVPTDMVDFEVELVVVIGRTADAVGPEHAWSHVAGLMVGQDISARNVQRAGQLSMGKSFRTFGPTGPWVTTVDDFTDPDDLAMRCLLDGEVVQDARTSDMVFDVAAVLAALSAVTPLLPGDLVFTGTPAGVGVFRTPPVFLRPGRILESHIEGIGSLRNRCVESVSRSDMDTVWRGLTPAP